MSYQTAKQPLESAFVYTPVLGLQTPMAAPDFNMGGGEQNAGPPVCIASTLPTCSDLSSSLNAVSSFRKLFSYIHV